tara:strand:- start:203 stop:436 length:234 start_codon:yes stop_codon:yes gene_type:complete
MIDKGFEDKNNFLETPVLKNNAEKPLKPDENPVKKRVDINILKSKLQESESKEFRKNLVIFLSFLVGLGSIGIYLSI